MKRLFGMFSLALILGAVSMSHVVFADNDDDDDRNRTIKICRVEASRTLRNGRTTVIGTIQEIYIGRRGRNLLRELARGSTIALSGNVGDCCAYCVTQRGLFCPPNID